MSKTNIAQVAVGIIDLIQVGREVYRAAADAMDAIESKGVLKGDTKKDWVLSFMREFVFELGESWDVWFPLLFDFIDKLKAAYNAVRDLF